MELLLKKNTPNDLSTTGRCIEAIDGTYMVVAGHIATYQSKNRGLNLEFAIESMKDQEEFSASFKISSKVNKNLSALSKGKKDVTFGLDRRNHLYLITNQHIKVSLHHADVNLMMPTIEESINDVEQIGPPVTIYSRHELGLTGREKTVSLVVRDDTFTGIISTSGEYFFDPDYLENVGVERLIYKSCFFLKIGKEQFTLRLYRKENIYLLLTEVSIGTGIKCKMLETLMKK